MLREVFLAWDVHTEHDDSPQVRNITSVPRPRRADPGHPSLVRSGRRSSSPRLLEEWDLATRRRAAVGTHTADRAAGAHRRGTARRAQGGHAPPRDRARAPRPRSTGTATAPCSSLRADAATDGAAARAALARRPDRRSGTSRPCEIVAGFYPRLHKPAPPPARRACRRTSPGTSSGSTGCPGTQPCHGGLVEQAVSLGRAFADDPATDGRLIHADLHYENVLAAEREPWLVIDPQPMSGDPHYEVGAAALEPLGRARRRRAVARRPTPLPRRRRRGRSRRGPGPRLGRRPDAAQRAVGAGGAGAPTATRITDQHRRREGGPGVAGAGPKPGTSRSQALSPRLVA